MLPFFFKVASIPFVPLLYLLCAFIISYFDEVPQLSPLSLAASPFYYLSQQGDTPYSTQYLLRK